MDKTTSTPNRPPRTARDRTWMQELLRAFVKNPDQPTTQSVVDTVLDLIAQGILLPGDRLPSLGQMAERFGVDTYSIQLAYQRLQKLGVTSARDRSGSFVASADAVHTQVGGQQLSQAILACRKMDMNKKAIAALFKEQMARHFPDEQNAKRTRSANGKPASEKD